MLRYMYVILILLGLVLNSYKMIQYSAFRGADFDQDYTAASRLLDGLSIYHGHEANLHPPFNALFFTPLTFFSIQEAFIILGVLSLAVLWINALMIENGLNLKRMSASTIYIFSLFWPVTFSVVCLGASSALWTGAVTAGWLCEKKNRPIAAGIFIGLAILIKLIPGIIVIMWCLNRRWRAAMSATMVVLAGFLLMTALCGFDDVLYYFFTRVPDNTSKYLDFISNSSISGAAEKLFGSNGGWSKSLVEVPLLSKGIPALGSAAVVLATMIISSFNPTKKINELVDYRTALVIVTMLLVSPLTWPTYYVVLLFPLTLLFTTANNDSSINIKDQSGVLFSIILLLIPIVVMELSGRRFQFWSDKSAAIQLITLSETIGLFMLWTLLAKRIILLRNA